MLQYDNGNSLDSLFHAQYGQGTDSTGALGEGFGDPNFDPGNVDDSSTASGFLNGLASAVKGAKSLFDNFGNQIGQGIGKTAPKASTDALLSPRNLLVAGIGLFILMSSNKRRR